MRISFTNTLDDFREAVALRGTLAARANRWLSGAIGAITVAVIVSYGLVGARWINAQAQNAPQDDVLLALIPPLIPTLLFAAIIAVIWASADARGARRTVFRRKAYATAIIIGLMTSVMLLVNGTHWDVAATRALRIAMSILPSLAVLIVTISMIYYDRPDQAAMVWRRQKLADLPQVIEVDREGLRALTDRTDLLYRWPCFNGGRETENLYILKMVDERFFMIPKRAFTDLREEVQFRLLIKGAIPATILAAREAAFEVVVAVETAEQKPTSVSYVEPPPGASAIGDQPWDESVG